MKRLFTLLASSLLTLTASPVLQAAPPRDAVLLDAAELPLNFRLHVEFSAPAGGAVRLGKDFVVPLATGSEHDVAVEHPAKGAPVLRVWSGGKLVRGPEEIVALSQNGAADFPAAKLDLGGDFTAAVGRCFPSARRRGNGRRARRRCSSAAGGSCMTSAGSAR